MKTMNYSLIRILFYQFLFIDDSAEILQRFEKTARNMHSLSKYSRANQLNKQWIDAYLDEANSFGPVSYTHLDVYKRQIPFRGP